jgi:hypothetical protein
MMCSSFTVQASAYTYYDNPWTLPAFRMLSSIMLWFLVMVFSTGLLALLHLHRRTEEDRRRMAALTGVCTMSAGVLVAGIAAMIALEPSLGGAAGLFSFCAAAAFAFLLTASLARRSKRANIKELANPLPLIAAITMLIGLIIPAISVPLSPETTIISEAVMHLPDFALAAAACTSGLILTSIYIVRRRSELSTIEGAQTALSGRGG